MRIAVDPGLGGGDADLLQCRDSAGAGIRAGQAEMLHHGFGKLVADLHQRIERGQRVLEDHADPLAADAAHLFGREIVDPLIPEPDLAARDPPGPVDEPDHGGTRDRLASTAFADDAENGSPGQLETDAVDGTQPRPPRRNLHHEVAHGEDWLLHFSHHSPI